MCPSPARLSSFPGVRAHSAAPLGHGPSSATRIRASSAVPPCHGSNSIMAARAPNAAPFDYDPGACDPHTPRRHASRSKKAAVTTRRPHSRAGSSPLFSDREEAAGLRCGKASPNTPRVLLGSIRCFLAIVAGALSFVLSRRSRQAYLTRLPHPRGLTKSSLLGQETYTTCPSPALEDAHRVYWPCFALRHANPRVSGYVCPSGAG